MQLHVEVVSAHELMNESRVAKENKANVEINIGRGRLEITFSDHIEIIKPS